MGRSQGLHCLLLWSASLLVRQAVSQSARNQVTKSDDVQWGSQPTQLAKVYTPGHATAPSSGWPAVFMLHGKNGNRNKMDGLAKDIAAEGDGMITIPYGNDAYPADAGAYPTIGDVQAMVNFFKDRASQYNIDITNLFLYGYSKGGFKSIDTCFQHTTLVRGCIIIAGTGQSAKDRVVEGAPPFLVVHSTDDETVPYSNVPPFISKLEERNVPNELKRYTSAGHFPPSEGDFAPTVAGWIHGFDSETGVLSHSANQRAPYWLLWAIAASSARMAWLA